MSKVSVIVPIYNKENTLKRCIDSILFQEYKDLELILVDDGSSDNSAHLCDEYKKIDNRVIVIHKKNTGVSDTRNYAIKISTGEFIQFVDADDYITKDATKLMVRTIVENNADMVIANFYRVVGKNASIKGDIDEKILMSTSNFADIMVKNPADYYYGVLWNKLFKSSIIKQYNIKMDPKLKWCEDFIFNLEYMLNIKTIVSLPVPIYYYVKMDGSLISQNLNIYDIVRMKLNVIEYYNNFYKKIYNVEDYKKNRFRIYRFLIEYAKDEFAIPLLPGTKKIGQENIPIYANIKTKDNIFFNIYLIKKLLDRYLKTIAIQYNLDLIDIKVISYLKYNKNINHIIEISDYINCSQFSVFSSLQKLTFKKIVEKIENKHITSYNLTNNSKNIVKDIDNVVRDFFSICSDGLNDEEKNNYYEYYKKSLNNIKKILDDTNAI